LLTEVVPQLSKIGVLRDDDSRNTANRIEEYESSGRALKISVQSLAVRGSNPDIEGVIQNAAKGRANGLITITTGSLVRHQRRIAKVAMENRLTSIFEGHTWVEQGGLMSYSADDLAAFRRAAF
jgi:putative tryptophan/tyrosine transport system substrate-binding protein